PVPAPPVTLSLRWHPTLTDDPGHRWFREMLQQATRLVALPVASSSPVRQLVPRGTRRPPTHSPAGRGSSTPPVPPRPLPTPPQPARPLSGRPALPRPPPVAPPLTAAPAARRTRKNATFKGELPMPVITPSSDVDLFADDVLTDPYPAYRELREAGPAVRLT